MDMRGMLYLFIIRFGTVAFVTAEVIGAITGRIPWDSLQSAVMILAAAAMWALGDVYIQVVRMEIERKSNAK